MPKRRLGPLTVSAIGLGCMNLSHAYGTPPGAADGARLLHRALDSGVDFLDTAALYGFGANESLLGQALKGQRQRFTLASKCGMTGVDGKRVIDGRPATLKATCEGALQRLQTEVIDLYYLHRRDFTVPIEDSVGATFVAFSPLGRGFLGGELSDPATQLALAWILAKQPDMVVIPGTRSPAHLEDNLGAARVRLTPATMVLLDALINQKTVVGPRYNAATQKEIDTEQFAA